ncbi:sugar kinase [Photobacterium rosenbergii]|uniref:Sugar kinase n=1 Tax=Photobacterium rosenbergii TaxID=294936 RepID=A0ABU3ZI65_9GAMM|nr:sugar kinase [Photobacterium rosenbergii]MDV5169807.1 sugar kinase [Photobacterium rosenbergii]
MFKVAVIGECMIEINGEMFGQSHQAFGGDTLNTAIYLARACDEVEVSYVTALGNDALSDGMLAKWQEEGINTQWVLRDSKRQPGLYMIQLDAQGERSFLYWRSQSAARYLLEHPEFDQLAQELEQVDMVYLSGISLAILPEQDRIRLLDLLEKLHIKGVELAFDSNFRPALWQDLSLARYCYRRIYGMTSVAMVTDEDEGMLWGDSCSEETLSRLGEMGVKKVVLKQGGKGALYQNLTNNSASTLIPTIPVDNIVDTTSAGDSFNAGFLSGYLKNKSTIDCVTQGHLLAGKVIQYKGAIIPREVTSPVIAIFNNLHAL